MSAQDRAREEAKKTTVSVSGVKKPTQEEQIKAGQASIAAREAKKPKPKIPTPTIPKPTIPIPKRLKETYVEEGKPLLGIDKHSDLGKQLKQILTWSQTPQSVTDFQKAVKNFGPNYEKSFTNVLDSSAKVRTDLNKAAVKMASTEPVKGVGAYMTGAVIRTGEGVFNAVTFPIRPAAWSKTMNTIGALLTPNKGESIKEYENRIQKLVAREKPGEFDAAMIKDITTRLKGTIPYSPISGKDIRKGKAIQKAFADTIAEDPFGFVAEVAGGVVGGKIALKAISKIPGVKGIVSRQTLEQRMWDKVTPIDKIGTTVPHVHTPSDWTPTQMPKGTWRSTWEIARDVTQKGGTAVVMLKDVKTGKLTGFMSWEQAMKVTGGLPELLGAFGTISGVEGKVVVEPVVVEDSKLKQSGYLDAVQRLTNEELAINQPVSIETIEKELQKLEQEQEEGVIVGPPEPEVLVPPAPIVKQIPEQEQEEEPVIVGPPEPDVPVPPISIVKQTQEQEEEQEEEESKPIVPIIPPKMKKGDPGSRPNVFRALVGGLKEKYRVVFNYRKGKDESFTVTARSFPQALSQATQLRRVKYVPSEVDVAKVGK